MEMTVFCDAAHLCGSNQYECDNGNCILAEYFCDGYQDCTDMSDEQNCTSTPAPSKYNHLVIGLSYCFRPSAVIFIYLTINSNNVCFQRVSKMAD